MYTLYNVRYSLHFVYTLHFTLYNVHCTMYSVKSNYNNPFKNSSNKV